MMVTTTTPIGTIRAPPERPRPSATAGEHLNGRWRTMTRNGRERQHENQKEGGRRRRRRKEVNDSQGGGMMSGEGEGGGGGR
eukprot:2202866-Pyramimonas_sp.AAC.1